MRPWLLLDVDGPLNPYAAWWFRTGVPVAGYAFHHLTLGVGRSYRVALNPTHGAWLRDLSSVVDLAWASTWQAEANRLIAPILGLPTDLPVVPLEMPAPGFPDHGWKTDQVAAWVEDRPFVWLDDEITAATCERLMATTGIGPHLARFVAPEAGLAATDIEAARAFVASLA